MKNDKNYVWYAVYGSNLLSERFNKYVKGGIIKISGKNKKYYGCNCKTLPLKNKDYIIPHVLYFANESETWNYCGVAFIRSEECDQDELKTLGRIYLIRKDQFIDILHQENGKKPPYNGYSIDFDNIIKNKIQIVGENGWYTKIIYLNKVDDFPVFTFTGRWNDNEIIERKKLPSRLYRSYIIKGLQETYPTMSLESIYFYLYRAGGVNNSENVLVTRKEWECFQCGCLISAGEQVTLHRFYVGKGKYAKNYYCKKCKPIGL